eukprot:gene421-biopygen3873
MKGDEIRMKKDEEGWERMNGQPELRMWNDCRSLAPPDLPRRPRRKGGLRVAPIHTAAVREADHVGDHPVVRGAVVAALVHPPQNRFPGINLLQREPLARLHSRTFETPNMDTPHPNTPQSPNLLVEHRAELIRGEGGGEGGQRGGVLPRVPRPEPVAQQGVPTAPALNHKCIFESPAVWLEKTGSRAARDGRPASYSGGSFVTVLRDRREEAVVAERAERAPPVHRQSPQPLHQGLQGKPCFKNHDGKTYVGDVFPVRLPDTKGNIVILDGFLHERKWHPASPR